MLEATATPAARVRAWWAAAPAREVLLNLALAGGAWLLAELTLLPRAPAARVLPLWPVAGLGVAAVLLGGVRLLPGVAIGAFLGSVTRHPIAVALSVAAATAAQAYVTEILLRRLRFDPRMEHVRDALKLGLAAPAGGLITATAGTIAAVLTADVPRADWGTYWTSWWLRDWLGIQIVVALIATWARARPIKWTWRRIGEAAALMGVMLLATQLLFGLWGLYPGQNVPLAFVFFPIVGYAGLRFGPIGAATLVMTVAAMTVPIAAMGLGATSVFPPMLTQLVLHLFLVLGAFSGQTLAAVMAEREEALQRRVALEEQLRHSQKMEAIGRLAGGIAHDFNNLLTAIIGYTEIVMTGFGPADPRRADAEEISRAAMRAADLTRQMLAFSRKQILQSKVVDLNVQMSKVEPMLRRVIGEDIVMTISPKASRAQVRVDPGQLEQVIMNLVVNARDAMPQGGRLTVETADATLDSSLLPPDGKPGPYAMLAVSDTGIGMPPEVRARIFEPYFTTKEVGKGTGLGLSTAYGIVRQSDGHIHVYSEPGLGTTFRIYLPRVDAEVAMAAETGAAGMPSGNEHVLLVEDDPSVRRLSREILTRLGYSVTEAASGRAGLALGSDDTRHFDLALCDVILGDMSGPAVFEALRALRPSVRVLYMSGYADEAIVRTGVLEEGQPFLQKPFTPQDLAVKIREVLDAPET